jgi:hypothetical protein
MKETELCNVIAQCCSDCRFWRGRCVKDKPNRIAWSEPCELFKPIDVVQIMMMEILTVKAW